MATIAYKLFYNTSAKRTGHKGWSIAVAVNGSTHYFLDFRKPEHWSLVTYAPDDFRLPILETAEKINAHLPEDKWLLMADFKIKDRAARHKQMAWTALLDMEGHNPVLEFIDWNNEYEAVRYPLMPYSHFNDGNAVSTSRSEANPPAFMFIDNWDPLELGGAAWKKNLKPAPKTNIDQHMLGTQLVF